MFKKGDWILFNGKRKKCFGIHTNGNILIKMNRNLVQIPREKCGYPEQGSYIYNVIKNKGYGKFQKFSVCSPPLQ